MHLWLWLNILVFLSHEEQGSIGFMLVASIPLCVALFLGVQEERGHMCWW